MNLTQQYHFQMPIGNMKPNGNNMKPNGNNMKPNGNNMVI